MGKPFYNLLLAFVVYDVCLAMSLADNSCPVVGRSCNDLEDKKIMLCCLKNYTLGFNDLPSTKPGEDPPSCRLDLGLAECLSRSSCFASVTDALRILILNQLVFTKQVGICTRSKFGRLLEEAEKGLGSNRPEDVEALKNVREMEAMPAEPCATLVYAICGTAFKDRLQEIQPRRFDPLELCNVFHAEGDCINAAKVDSSCTKSQVLNRFKQNSDYAAKIVLPALCFPPSTEKPKLT